MGRKTSINQSVNQSIDRSIDRSINRSIDRSLTHSHLTLFCGSKVVRILLTMKYKCKLSKPTSYGIRKAAFDVAQTSLATATFFPPLTLKFDL